MAARKNLLSKAAIFPVFSIHCPVFFLPLGVSGNFSATKQVCGLWGVPVLIRVPARIRLRSFLLNRCATVFLLLSLRSMRSVNDTFKQRRMRLPLVHLCSCPVVHTYGWQDAAGFSRPALCHRNSSKWRGGRSVCLLLLPITDPISDAWFSAHQSQALHFNTSPQSKPEQLQSHCHLGAQLSPAVEMSPLQFKQ